MTRPARLPDEETQHLLQFLYVCPVGLIAFDDAGTIDQINPAAVNLLVAVADLVDHRNVFRMFDALWPELEEVVTTGAGCVGHLARDHRVRSRPGRAEQWLSLAAVCVADNRNMLTVSDVTSTVMAEQQLAESLSTERRARRRVELLERGTRRIADQLGEADRRHTFLLEVSDTLRGLRDPHQIGLTFVTMLGRQLGAHQAFYARVGEAADQLTVENAYTAPGHDGPGHGTAADVDLAALGLVGDGTILAIDDVRSDRRLASADRASILSLGCGSLLLAPLFVDGHPTRLLCVADVGPRAWSHHELTLVAEVADRLWSAEGHAATDRDSEARLASIIDTAAECILVTDSSGTIQLANRATTATFGYPIDELLGRNVAFLLSDSDSFQPNGTIDRAGSTVTSPSTGVSREVEGRRRDGSSIPLDLAATEWYDSERERFVTGILRDTTQRREQAEALARARKLEVAGQLAGGVAHDLNNLLMVIGGNLELAEERIGDAGTRTLLSRALHAVRRGVTFNNRLLSLVHDRPRNVQPLLLADRLADVGPMVQHLVGPDVALEVHVAPGSWPVLVDPGELDSALLNLAGNARDAMTGGGRLTIDVRNVTSPPAGVPTPTSARGRYVVLLVTDTGAGMTPDVAQRATDPFFTTKPPGRGSGLGLASVAGFVHSAGGFLTVDSEPERGTTVALHLPRAVETAASIEPPDQELASGAGQRILVVDDDELVRQTTTSIVEALGYAVVGAGDGAEAISLLRQDPGIELVLSDIVMPNVDGRELAAWVETNRPEVGIVLCSGYDRAWSGTDATLRWPYLAKPYTRQQLSQALARLLRSRGRAS